MKPWQGRRSLQGLLRHLPFPASGEAVGLLLVIPPLPTLPSRVPDTEKQRVSPKRLPSPWATCSVSGPAACVPPSERWPSAGGPLVGILSSISQRPRSPMETRPSCLLRVPSPTSIAPGALALASRPPLSPGPLPGRPPGPGRRPLSRWRPGLTPNCRLPSAPLAESEGDRHRVDPALPAARPRSTARRPPAAALTPSPFSLLRWPTPSPRSGARPASPPVARPGPVPERSLGLSLPLLLHLLHSSVRNAVESTPSARRSQPHAPPSGTY